MMLKKLNDVKKIDELIEFIENLLKKQISKLELLHCENIESFYNCARVANKVMTIHQSKGLEAEHVYVKINNEVVNGTFFNFDSSVTSKYFVAFTRSKSKLYISANEFIIKEFKQFCFKH